MATEHLQQDKRRFRNQGTCPIDGSKRGNHALTKERRHSNSKDTDLSTNWSIVVQGNGCCEQMKHASLSYFDIRGLQRGKTVQTHALSQNTQKENIADPC